MLDGKLLIVEDEEDLRSILDELFEPHIKNIVCLSNGKEAYEYILKHDDINCVLSDFTMPQSSGVTLIKNVRLAKIHIPFIFMTGYTNDEDLNSALEHGIFNLLRKPFDNHEIIHTAIEAVQFNKSLRLNPSLESHQLPNNPYIESYLKYLRSIN